MKKCNRCKEELPLEDYALQPSRPDGRYSICNSCRKKARDEKDKREYDLIYKALGVKGASWL